MVGERPQDAALHHQLGKLHFELNEPEAAHRMLSSGPSSSTRAMRSAIYWIGGIKQTAGEIEAAKAAYAEAARIQPLISRPAAKFPADFRVLALFAPFAGNIRTEYLFRDCAYDTDTLALFASCEFDVEVLRRDVQVVVNLISDADQADGLLPLAADLADRLGKPIVNDPRKIQRTTRDAVAALLQGMPGCIVPKILRQKAGTELAIGDLAGRALRPRPPFWCGRPGPMAATISKRSKGRPRSRQLLAQPAECDRYFIEYIDYRSPDGYFRKYRFIFVDGEILPYHLAIAEDWKVHHDSDRHGRSPMDAAGRRGVS